MTLSLQAAGLAALSLLVFGIWGWGQVVTRWRRGEPILPWEPRRPVPWTLFDLLLMLGGFVVAQMTAAAVLRQGLGKQAINLETANEGQLTALVAAQGLANLAAWALAVGVVVGRAKGEGRDLGLSAAHLSRDVKMGVAAFFTLALPVLAMQAALVQWMPSEHPLIMMLRNSPNSWLFAASFAVAVIVAPVVEEFFFRVFLQGWLEKVAAPQPVQANSASGGEYGDDDRLTTTLAQGAPLVTQETSDNPYFAPAPSTEQVSNHAPPAKSPVEASLVAAPPSWPIFVSAAIFALMHFSHGPDPIPLFFLALGLGYVYRQTHRVMPCIIVHFLLNGMSMTLLWLEITTSK